MEFPTKAREKNSALRLLLEESVGEMKILTPQNAASKRERWTLEQLHFRVHEGCSCAENRSAAMVRRYSSRRVIAGLMRAMRSTGTAAARSVTAVSVRTTMAIVGASYTPTP